MSEAGVFPICFGAVSMFSEDSDRCLACAAFQECRPATHANAQRISQVLDIDDLLARHRAAKNVAPKRAEKLAADGGGLVTQAPVERAIDPSIKAAKRALAASILSPLLAGGTPQTLRAELTAGRNPFQQAMREQWVVCELLRQGATTRALVERAVGAISGDKARTKAYVSVLLAASIVTAGEEDQLLLNRQ